MGLWKTDAATDRRRYSKLMTLSMCILVYVKRPRPQLCINVIVYLLFAGKFIVETRVVLEYRHDIQDTTALDTTTLRDLQNYEDGFPVLSKLRDVCWPHLSIALSSQHNHDLRATRPPLQLPCDRISSSLNEHFCLNS